jgi:CSLREA domain-containing protein
VSLNLIGSAVAEQQMTIQYSLMATYEDGSIVDVTGQAEWHGGSNNATMNNGLLTTMDLPCDVQTFLSATFLDLHAEKAIVLATPRKTYVVDTLTDTLDGTDGKTSLREALSAANSNTSVYGLFAGSGVFVDMIVFDGNLAGGTCNLSRGQLTITDSVTIIGLGTDELTIDANHTSRVLDISGSNVVANISSLTISGGEVGLGWGGGISNNSKKLTLMNAKVIGNHSNNFYGKGGGIYNDSGVLELLNTVVSGNSCSSGGGYYATAFGGGIYINNGMMALINSVVSGNFVSGAPNMHGGGIFNSGAASIVNTTVTGNLSSGGIFSSGALIIQNTIIALNMDYDMSGTYTGSNNIVGRDPLFVDSVNGDYRLKKGSTAIDAGNNNFALNAAGNQLELDLGGNPRIAGALVDIGPLVDIGAYEYIKRPDVSIGSSDVRILNHLGIASDKPVIDELMQVEVTVHNIGETATVNDLLVQLFQDNAPQDISHYDVNSFNLAATGVISNRIPAGGSATILIPWLATGPARVLALWPVVEFADNRVQSQAGRSLPIDELSLDNNNTWRTVLIGSAGIGGFALWAYERGLPSNPAVASGGDGIANIYKYAFGNNLQAGDPLMKVKFANGVRVVEFPAQDMATLPYVNINVRASTNLINWTLALIPASNTTGKPANRNWFVPSGNPKKAFFSLGANLVTQP